MEQLQSVTSLAVKQKKEWGEIVSGFETKNKYVVMDQLGNELFYAVEVGGSFLLRSFLRGMRPFTMDILLSSGERVLQLRRPFRFILSHLDIYDRQGTKIGSLQQRFTILKRLYSVYGAEGQCMAQLVGPILHPWTFHVVRNGVEVGSIKKQWSGMGKEMFTDADNFSATFPPDFDEKQKSILLGAIFLIDFVHFENRK